MSPKKQRTILFILLLTLGFFGLKIASSISSRLQLSGQPSEVSGTLEERGDYIDVLLTIQNNRDRDILYNWEIIFHGNGVETASFAETVKSGNSLLHITSFAAPLEKKSIVKAEIKVYEEERLIDERIYFLNSTYPTDL